MSEPLLAIAPGLSSGGVPAAVFAFAGLAVIAAIFALTHQGDRAFSPSIVHLAIGAALAAAINLVDVPLIALAEDADVVQHATEVAVIVALFATGLRIDRVLGWRGWRSVVLLLGVVMPLTIAAVTLWGTLAMGLSLGAALVLGAALSPTDPVLAGDLGVGGPGEGGEEEPRFAVTTEAGLNDGLAFPFVLLGLLLAGGDGVGGLVEWALADALYATVAGLALGAIIGRLLAAGATRLRERGLLDTRLDGWAAIGAVLLIYGVTELAGAYGFLAAFAGGLAFRRREEGHEYNAGVHSGAEVAEEALELAVIVALGAALTLEGLRTPGASGWLLVPLLLVLVRPAAALLAFLRCRLRMGERLWIGWFGVRGVGSLYYAAAAVASGLLAPAEARVVLWTVVACVVVSIVVHGVSGSPLTRWLLDRPAARGEPALDPAPGGPRAPRGERVPT